MEFGPPAEGGELFFGHMGDQVAESVLFVVSHLWRSTYTATWSHARHDEALRLFTALRIRPSYSEGDVEFGPEGARSRQAFITYKAFSKLMRGRHAAWDTVHDFDLPGLRRAGGPL